MKNVSHIMLAGFLSLCSALTPLNAEETKTSWQKWKKPIIGTTLVVGGIAGWLLLDYYLKGQFNSKLNATTNALVNDRSNSFFERNGELRKYPNLSAEQLKDQALVDRQLYENARFGNMFIPGSKVVRDVLNQFKYFITRGNWIHFSTLAYCARGFNMNLLAHQLASKFCFLVALFGGGYLLTDEDTVKNLDDTNTAQA